MFNVIYKFEVKLDSIVSFEKSWKELTLLIYKTAGSLGSRLHKTNLASYIAYAQWPNKETWQNSQDRLPKKAYSIKELMKDSCHSIETLFELELIEDLLKIEPNPLYETNEEQ